jgi:hypothetical protein
LARRTGFGVAEGRPVARLGECIDVIGAILDEVAVCGTSEQARQICSAGDAEELAGYAAFLGPPSSLVSERRMQHHVRVGDGGDRRAVIGTDMCL